MADDENGVEGNTRGNEWEVVSLTASTYAAAPGPKEIEPTDDDNDLTRTGEESSQALFMSHHFVFSASQDENLTLEPDISKICSELGVETESADKSSDENLKVKELSDVDDHNVIQFFDEKNKRLSPANMNFEEGKDLQGLDLLEEHHLYGASKSSSFHNEADISGSTSFDESTINPEECDPQKNLDAPLDSLKSQDSIKEDRPDLPCEAWWKRQAASLYTHAKEANTFWSVIVAATLMGLVILGQRWQLQQLKWQFGVNDEMCLSVESSKAQSSTAGHRQGVEMTAVERGPTADDDDEEKHGRDAEVSALKLSEHSSPKQSSEAEGKGKVLGDSKQVTEITPNKRFP